MKKRILGLILSLVMIMTFFATLTVSAMTPQEGADWALAQVGKSIDVDGYYGAQCVDLIKKYCQDNWGWSPRGNAKDYASIALPDSSWTRIKNTPEFIPQPGDIAIWTNNTYGHVAIIISANISSFVSVDQNWYNANGTVGSPAAQVTHNYSGFWGVIRPPFSSSAETSQSIHASTEATVRNGYFTFKNVLSGSFMNVWGGKDANKTAVTTYTFDGSVDQRFNVVHFGDGKYKLYAECSSSGTNRVVDVYRNGAAPSEGQLIDLWTPDDDTAQLFYIVPIDDGSYVFELAAKDGYVIAPANESVAGSNTTSSQLTLQRYTGASYQKWNICNNNGKATTATGNYVAGSYLIDTDGDSVNMRDGAGASHTRIGSIPDKTTVNVTSVNGNWGYTTYNSTGGWFCLDYTVFNPEITSISIGTEPRIKTYFVGEDLDTTNLSVNVTYSNNFVKNITSGFDTSYDFSNAGTKTVTVTYSGKTATFTVEVVEPAIKKLEITSQATKKSYTVGDSIDTSGLKLKATYNNGSEKTVTEGFTTSYDFSTSGTKTVEVKYDGLKVTYDVTVEKAETAVISITSPKSAKKGDEIEVSVKLDNSETVYDGNFILTYDNEILKIKDKSIGNILKNQNPTVNTEYAQNKIKLSFAGTTAVADGNLMTLTFEIISASKESASISISEANMYNAEGRTIDITRKNTPFTIAITDSENEEDSPYFELSSVSGRAGDTVKVSMYIRKNPGIAGAMFTLTYAEELTIVSMEKGEALPELTFTVPGNLKANPLTLPWDGIDADSSNGEILIITFKIADDAEEGEYEVKLSYKEGHIYDNDQKAVHFDIKNGKITVADYIPGDINGDGEVTTLDVTVLRRYIAGGYDNVSVVEAATDVNGDGEVTTLDVTVLRRYIAGGYGVEL